MSYLHYPNFLSFYWHIIANLDGFCGISRRKVSLNVEPEGFAYESTLDS
jgi:hypothetical protein